MTANIIQIVGGIKLFTNIPHICASCLLYQLTAHALYGANPHYIELVDKLKDVETMEEIHHILHLLTDWAEANHILIQITLN